VVPPGPPAPDPPAPGPFPEPVPLPEPEPPSAPGLLLSPIFPVQPATSVARAIVRIVQVFIRLTSSRARRLTVSTKLTPDAVTGHARSHAGGSSGDSPASRARSCHPRVNYLHDSLILEVCT
jgi:hypothetical protein